MFLIRWTRTLLSLPFLWVGQVMAMFNMAPAAYLLKTAWAISGSGEVALNTLIFLNKIGRGRAAREQADIWMARRPRVEIASFAGLLAIDDGDLETAKTCLRRCGDLGEDRTGMVDLLEFFVASREDNQTTRQTVNRLAKRNDLPPILTKLLLTELIWSGLLEGNFDEARQRAMHLLEVDDDPRSHLAMWAIERHEGNEQAAEAHLPPTMALPQADRLNFQCLGAHAIGQRDEARTYLTQLRQVDPDRASSVERLLCAEDRP